MQQIKEQSRERDLLVLLATRLSLENGLEVGRVRTWANVQAIDLSDGDYPAIYPHKHATEPGVTLVFYLSVDAASPALEILADDHSIEETHDPQAGDAALIRNGVWHQVRKNRGPSERMAAICEVYP